MKTLVKTIFTAAQRHAPDWSRPWRLLTMAALAGALATGCGGGGDATAPAVLDKANMAPAAKKANDSFVLFDVAQLASVHAQWGNDWFENGKAYSCGWLFLDDDTLDTTGTVTFLSSRPGDTFEPGDSITVAYNNCLLDPDDQTRINGTLMITLTASGGDPESTDLDQPWFYRIAAKFGNLTVFSPNERSVVDGDMVVTESSTGLLNTDGHERQTTSFDTARLTLTEDADTHTYTKSNGTLVLNYTSERTWVATVNSDLSSNTFSGTLNFATVEPFRGGLDDSFPSEGLGRIQLAQQPEQLQLRAQPTGVSGKLTKGQTAEEFFVDWVNF